MPLPFAIVGSKELTSQRDHSKVEKPNKTVNWQHHIWLSMWAILTCYEVFKSVVVFVAKIVYNTLASVFLLIFSLWNPIVQVSKVIEERVIRRREKTALPNYRNKRTSYQSRFQPGFNISESLLTGSKKSQIDMFQTPLTSWHLYITLWICLYILEYNFDEDSKVSITKSTE